MDDRQLQAVYREAVTTRAARPPSFDAIIARNPSGAAPAQRFTSAWIAAAAAACGSVAVALALQTSLKEPSNLTASPAVADVSLARSDLLLAKRVQAYREEIVLVARPLDEVGTDALLLDAGFTLSPSEERTPE